MTERLGVTVADLISVLRTPPPTARAIVQDYETGFVDATGTVPQPIVACWPARNAPAREATFRAG